MGRRGTASCGRAWSDMASRTDHIPLLRWVRLTRLLFRPATDSCDTKGALGRLQRSNPCAMPAHGVAGEAHPHRVDASGRWQQAMWPAHSSELVKSAESAQPATLLPIMSRVARGRDQPEARHAKGVVVGGGRAPRLHLVRIRRVAHGDGRAVERYDRWAAEPRMAPLRFERTHHSHGTHRTVVVDECTDDRLFGPAALQPADTQPLRQRAPQPSAGGRGVCGVNGHRAHFDHQSERTRHAPSAARPRKQPQPNGKQPQLAGRHVRPTIDHFHAHGGCVGGQLAHAHVVQPAGAPKVADVHHGVATAEPLVGKRVGRQDEIRQQLRRTHAHGLLGGCWP